MILLKILAFICSTILIVKIAYSPFDFFFRLAAVILVVVAVRLFLLQ